MKKILILLTLCAFAFGASECDRKIDRINKEISFSKDPMFYDKKLEAKKLKEQEVEKIEKELDALHDQKDYMSKVEYKAKKKALKEQKEKIKKEIKEYIDNL